MPSTSLWFDTARISKFPKLSNDLRVDAVVIGGGNTGVSSAYLLKKVGLKVALIEREGFAGVDTGHTSAHLTYVTDLRVRMLVRRLGGDHARAVFDAGAAAIQQIESNIREEQIDCDFAKVPGYLHASLEKNSDERSAIRKEAEQANELGFDATFVDAV